MFLGISKIGSGVKFGNSHNSCTVFSIKGLSETYWDVHLNFNTKSGNLMEIGKACQPKGRS